MDATQILYTGLPLTHIPVTPNTNLQLILGLIDTAISNSSATPDYSGYNLFCVKQTDNTTHPTNTQNFAEGISKMFCQLKTDYTAFTSTYATNQGVIATAITGLQAPALVYSPFSITNVDTLTQVYAKMFTGFTGIINSIKPDAANWSTLGVSDATDIVTAFNTLIAILDDTKDTVSFINRDMYDDTQGPYNNSLNCLSTVGGGQHNTVISTIYYIIKFLCNSVPTFNINTYTKGPTNGYSPTDLQSVIQALTTISGYLLDHSVNEGHNGILYNQHGGTDSYSGAGVSIDPNYAPLYRVGLQYDPVSTADYLDQILQPGDGIDIAIVSGKLVVTNTGVANTSDHKVAIDQDDEDNATAGYLYDKILGSQYPAWGMKVNPIKTGAQVEMSTAIEGDTFVNALFDYIADDPILMARFCALVATCGSSSVCDAISDLVVEFVLGSFLMQWTPNPSAVSQIGKYRQRDTGSWVTNFNLDPANPQDGTNNGAKVLKLNMNTVYQFQVDTNCTSGTSSSNLYEWVQFADVMPNMTASVASHVVSVTTNPLVTCQYVEYTLVNTTTSAVVSTATTNSSSPTAGFQAVPTGTYHILYRIGATVNGTLVYSDSATWENAKYAGPTGIIVA